MPTEQAALHAVRAGDGFRALADVLPHALWLTRPDGTIEWANARATALLGLSQADVQGRRWTDFVHPDDVPEALSRWESAVKDRSEYRSDLRVRAADGRYRWFAWRGAPDLSAGGELEGWVGTLTEIEEHKRLARAMRATNDDLAATVALMDTLMSAAPVGMAFVDRQYRQVRANDVFVALTAGPPRPQIGQGVAGVVPELWPDLEPIFERVLSSGEPVVGLELKGPVPDAPGSRLCLVSLYPVRLEGRITGVGVVLVDITDRKRAEDSQRFQARLLDAAGEAIIATDLAGRIVYANAAAEQIYGWPADELLGMHASALAPEDIVEPAAEDIKARLGDARPWSRDFVALRRSGSRFPIRVTNTPLIDEDGRPLAYVSVSNDISDRKRSEERLSANLNAMIRTVATMSEHRDRYTAGHQSRVARLSAAIGSEMGLDDDTIAGITAAASIHDIGKIAVPLEILSKPGKLSPAEFEIVREHCQVGYDIIRHVDFPWPVAEMILQHHERDDGSGYPNRLGGTEVNMGAKVIAVADTVEAMGSHRPYRPALGLQAALSFIEHERGLRLDKGPVDACLRLFRARGFRLGTDHIEPSPWA